MSASVAERPKIGISACFMHPDPARNTFASKTLQYVEQSIAHWVMAAGALAVMVPSPAGATGRGDVTLDHYAEWLDALVLEGGVDVWPGSYGETPLDARWHGDRIRDEYEIALLAAFERRGKPVLGVCRGLQLMNVAFGGTLWQDLPSHRPGSISHRDAMLYDGNLHPVEFVEGSPLQRAYGLRTATINSVHHQGIKDLAPGFGVDARCPDDGMIEAIHRDAPGFMAAVQWHPEFHRAGEGTLDDRPLLDAFLAAAGARQFSSFN